MIYLVNWICYRERLIRSLLKESIDIGSGIAVLLFYLRRSSYRTIAVFS